MSTHRIHPNHLRPFWICIALGGAIGLPLAAAAWTAGFPDWAELTWQLTSIFAVILLVYPPVQLGLAWLVDLWIQWSVKREMEAFLARTNPPPRKGTYPFPKTSLVFEAIPFVRWGLAIGCGLGLVAICLTAGFGLGRSDVNPF